MPAPGLVPTYDLRDDAFLSEAMHNFDLVAVKETMGHSKLTTTERSPALRPRLNDATKLTEIFAEESNEDEGLAA